MILVALAASAATGEAPPAAAGPVVRDALYYRAGAVLYVSPEGNDAWTGALAAPNADRTDGPFATPARARDAVRALKAQGPLAAPVTVLFRGGTYYLEAPLVFAAGDSGTEACPVTYAAFEGERPVLSGGRPVTGWRREEGDRWVADVPGVKEGSWYFRQLFVGGARRDRPRLPKDGFYRIAKFPGGSDYRVPSDQFQFAGDDIRADWANLADVEVVALHFWVDVHLPVARVESATRTVFFTRKSRRRLSDDFSANPARYYVENVREALDRPGEWYLDRSTGRLTYLAMPGEDPSAAGAVAPRLEHLVRFEGRPADGAFVEHIRLRGLGLAHNEWNLPPDDAGDLQAAVAVPGAIYLSGARHCRIEGCTLAGLGTYAVELAEGCRDVRVVGCRMTDLGGGGVKISGGEAAASEPWRTAGNAVTDNHIYDGGKIWMSAVGILLRHAADNTIAHNHIHDLYYTGISVGWVWGYHPSAATGNRIEANHIHHIGRGLLSDMGGIYTLGPSPGTVLAGNVIHDVESYGYGGWGIYTDEGSTAILIENNIVYRTKTGGFHQHYGKENVVRNNIFAFSRTDQIQRSRAEPHLSFTFERNIVYWTEGVLLGKNWKDEQFRTDYNCYWNAAGAPVTFTGLSLEEWRKRGHDVHSVVADPLFVDPERGDFRLKPGSPALKLGFQPIDTSGVGPRVPLP